MKFELTQDQIEIYNLWRKELPAADSGAIGGRTTFSFTPTGLGVITRIKDNITGKELDLTEYEEW
jgi:hypothetical protein